MMAITFNRERDNTNTKRVDKTRKGSLPLCEIVDYTLVVLKIFERGSTKHTFKI